MAECLVLNVIKSNEKYEVSHKVGKRKLKIHYASVGVSVHVHIVIGLALPFTLFGRRSKIDFSAINTQEFCSS